MTANTTNLFSIDNPPNSVCIMRLSAIGDICHALPVIRVLQTAWPNTRFTWIIGKTEYKLIGDIPDIRFLVFDKAKGWRAYKDLARELQGEQFDLLLHMQEALRASIATRFINAKIRLGYNRKTAQDFQWLFTNRQIDAKQRAHYMDMLFGFAEALGISDKRLRWDIPISRADDDLAKQKLDGTKKYLVISPCSSVRKRNWRNWTIAGYAAVADYAFEKYGLRTVLTGSTTTLEQTYSSGIRSKMKQVPIDLMGQLSLKQLLAIVRDAVAVIAPDSGPVHMATAVATPAIGLFATSNPLFTGPYTSQRWVVNKYPEALVKFYGKTVDEVHWGKRVRFADAMEIITVKDVTMKLDELMSTTEPMISTAPMEHA